MLGQTEFLIIEGKIESRMAAFLLLKEKLSKLVLIPKTKDRANVLLAVQLKLEVDLRTSLNTIDAVKAGKYDAGDIALVIAFYWAMEKQIRDVEDLEREAGGVSAPSPTWLMPAAIGGVMLILYLIWRK
jgi:hypothetical protein